MLNQEQIAALKVERPDLAADVDYRRKGRFASRPAGKAPAKVMACGGGTEQMLETEAAVAEH